jgi:hypothetical protein
MYPNHPPTIDLDALQDRLDYHARQPLDERVPQVSGADVAALAIDQATDIELRMEPRVTLPVPQLGAEAAENMTKLSKAAAADIRRLGLLAFKAGKQVQDECEQMASDVEANGGTVALHLTGLSQLLADVGMSNRETLRRLSGPRVTI